MAKGLTASYDALPWILRIIIQIVFGVLVSGIYRIVRFVETKNVITLVVGILLTFTGVGNVIAWIVDLITTILGKGICILAD